ncbi:MAG: DUF456 domain-containing protein [Planctomycetia bacterium]|nr:DUF456 domain-containing protein [Planctomycetia bacterium]
MDYLWAVLFVVSLLVGWCLTVLTLPGNWVMVAAAALYAWLGPLQEHTRVALSWWAVLTLAVLATVGEGIEFLAGAMGARKGGGSKRAAVLSVVGSLVGSLVGGAIGGFIPPPVIGLVVAVIVCAGLGALGGAMLGEMWKGKDMNESLRVGAAAFWGRILGTLAKVMIASVMVAVGVVAVFVP